MRLRRSDGSGPGIARIRRGRGFRFPAKGGIERVATIRDAELAQLITALRRGRADDERLFFYRNGSGQRHEVTAGEINLRFKELAGAEFTVKDMRTWTATVLAATEFAALDPPRVEDRGQARRSRGDARGRRTTRQHPGGGSPILCGPPSLPHPLSLCVGRGGRIRVLVDGEQEVVELGALPQGSAAEGGQGGGEFLG